MGEWLTPLWSLFASHAYIVVFVVTAIDATGTPFPGRVLLIAAGALAASGDASIVRMILLAAAGAVIGDHGWYLVGRWKGQRILAFCCRITARSDDCVGRANTLLQRFGPFAVVISRFSTTLRVFVTATAAGSGLPYYQYLLAEIVGSLLWSATFVALGYGVGDYLYAFIGRPHGNAIVIIVLGGTLGLGVVAVGYRRFRQARR
jgi:membrane protein DedA with SNARE-associated domain